MTYKFLHFKIIYMKRLILLITSLLTLSVNLYSQNLLSDSVVNQPKTILRLSLLLPSFEVEQTIAKNTTIVFSLWTTFSYVKMIYANGSTSSLSFYPGFSIQPRFYRNLEERREMGKTTEYYSGMYIGIPLSVIKIAGFGASGGIEAGFQKKLGKSGFGDISLGVGLRTYQGQTGITPLGSLSFGFILN